MTPPIRSHRTRRPRLPLALSAAAAVGLGIGLLGGGTAFAQGAHRTHVSAASRTHVTLTKHERREAPSVRASETTSTDPAPGTPGEPTDASSSDPSLNDETAGDTSASDAGNSADSTPSPDNVTGSSSSVDQSSLKVSASRNRLAGGR
jgi:hypothetical protein